jgi:hypothetical protein
MLAPYANIWKKLKLVKHVLELWILFLEPMFINNCQERLLCLRINDFKEKNRQKEFVICIISLKCYLLLFCSAGI